MDQMDYEMHQAEVPTTQSPSHTPAHPTHSGFQGVPHSHGGCPYFRNEQQQHHHHQPSLPHLHPSYPPYHTGVNSLYHSPRQNQGPHAPRSSHNRNLSLQPHHHPQQPGHGQPQQQQTQNPPLSLPLPHPQSHSHSHSHSLSHPHPNSHYDPVYNPGWPSSAQNSGSTFQWTAPAPAPGPPPSHVVPLLSVPVPLQSLLRPSGSDPFFSSNGAGNANPSGSNPLQPGFHSTQNLPHLDSGAAPPFSFPYRHPSALHRFSVAPAIPNHHSHSNLPQAPAFPQAPTQNQNQQNFQSQPGRESLSSSGTMNNDRSLTTNPTSGQPSQVPSNTTMAPAQNAGTAPAPLTLPQLGELSGQSNRSTGNSVAAGQLPRPSQLDLIPDSHPTNHGGEAMPSMSRSVGEHRRDAIRRAQSVTPRDAAMAEQLAQQNGDDYDESEEDYSPIDEDEEAYRFATQFGAAHGYMGEDSRLRQQQVLRGQLASTKRVASKKALSSLQSVDMETLKESEKVCVICYNEFGVTSPEGVNEAPLRLPKCKHIFGDHCIKKWFEESDSCPYCRDKVPSEPALPSNLQQYIRANREYSTMMLGNAAGEPGSRFTSHPAPRSFQAGERRSSPSDNSTDSMRWTRTRIGSTRSYAPARQTLSNPVPHQAAHSAFHLTSMNGFGPGGPPPAGVFQPPSGPSGEQQMPFPASSVFLQGPFTQESSVGLTGQLRVEGQHRMGMGSSNSSTGRGHLRPDTTNRNSFSSPVPYPPLGGPLRHNPALLPRPELAPPPFGYAPNAPLTSPFSDATRGMFSSGISFPLQPRPNTAATSNAWTYTDEVAQRVSEELLADLEANVQAFVGRDRVGSVRPNNNQGSTSVRPSLLRSEAHQPRPNDLFPRSSRENTSEPPRKRRRSGSGGASSGEAE